jgi:CHAD domain-containing protein
LIAYQQHLAEDWQQARKNLLAAFSSDRYRQLKVRFSEFLQRGPADEAVRGGALSIGRAATRLIGKQYRRVLRKGRAITHASPDEALHELRIDCKRLRYLFEFFQPSYGKSLRPFIKHLKRLQDVLGEFQDACVATERLREYAEGVPLQAGNRGELIALGQLIGAQGRQAADRRAGFHDAWELFDRRQRRKQVLAALK